MKRGKSVNRKLKGYKNEGKKKHTRIDLNH